jgi:hypothetical protein
MTRTRIFLISSIAMASILGAALPAFAQAPAPAPMYAPAPPPMMAPPPGYAPAPGQEAGAVMPAAPVLAPRAADDMTGSLGFGVGVSTGTSLVAADTANLMMKYWMSDALAIVPRLQLTMTKAKDVDATWGFSPSVLASFNLLKGASTRFNAGVGLGLDLAKGQAPAAAASTDTYIGLYIPMQLAVEHFFTRWFAMGIAADFRFIDFAKQGDGWLMKLDISNVNYLGSLFFYTD